MIEIQDSELSIILQALYEYAQTRELREHRHTMLSLSIQARDERIEAESLIARLENSPSTKEGGTWTGTGTNSMARRERGMT